MESKISRYEVCRLYQEVMENEIKIRPRHNPNAAFGTKASILMCAAEFFYLVARIYEYARSSFVSRSYNSIYNLYSKDFVYESVAAHTNLVASVMTAALDFRYGYGFGTESQLDFRTDDGYSYREIMETVRLHDLAENETGDSPDNGTRNEDEKKRLELHYLKGFLNSYAASEERLKDKVFNLFQGMQEQSSDTGKMLYLADKVSALIVTISLDYLQHPPLILENSPYASDRDREEMKKCDFSCGHAYKASEMWAIDFFLMRKLVDLDTDFFFTALIVMITLIVNGQWYSWREANY